MENKIKNQHSSELLILNEHRSHSGPDGATSGQENEDLRSKSHHFSSLAEMMLSTNLMKKYSGSSFPDTATRISTACSENPISILTWDHIFYFPRKLLKWHQEEVSEGQDENPGERDRERRQSEGRNDRG